MSGLVEFLRARLDEDEAAARAATEGPWFADHPEPKRWGDDPESALIVRGKVLCILDNQYGGPLNVDHIVRHDPTRVLAEIAAKRELIRVWECLTRLNEDGGGYALGLGVASKALQLHAAVYANHPDYDERWRP